MASTTQFPSGLNNWAESDKPSRADFVNDNAILDEHAMWKREYDPEGAILQAGGLAAAVDSNVNSALEGVRADLANKANVDTLPRLLWKGTFTSGSITVPGVGQYTKFLFLVGQAAPSMQFGVKSGASIYVSGASYIHSGGAIGSGEFRADGEQLTWVAGSINIAVIYEIYGLPI